MSEQNPSFYPFPELAPAYEPPAAEEAPVPVPPPPVEFAGKEAVIQASRARYGTPRAVVERQVLSSLGIPWEESQDTEEGKARRGLRDAGIARDEIERLLEEFGLAACLRQVEWLPLRGAKNPARFLVAAIEGNYDPPRGSKASQLPTLDVGNVLEEVDELPEVDALDLPGFSNESSHGDA
jgi:hypothetical protein